MNSFLLSVESGEYKIVNDVKFYTKTQGSVVITSARNMNMRIVPLGGGKNVAPGQQTWFNLNGFLHILAMHKIKLIAEIRYHDSISPPFDFHDHVLKMVTGSTASFVDIHQIRSGDVRPLETITKYGEVVNSAIRHQEGPGAYDEMSLFNCHPFDKPAGWKLYFPDASYGDGQWSFPIEREIPVYNMLTANGECYFPIMNLVENFALGFKMASANSAFTPFAMGDGPFLRMAPQGAPSVFAEHKVDYESMNLDFVTKQSTFDYIITQLSLELDGVVLELGAGVNISPWYFDTLETQVFEHATTNEDHGVIQIHPDRTSVTSIRTAFIDPQSEESQQVDRLPADIHPRGALYARHLYLNTEAYRGRVKWYRFRHGRYSFPTEQGTGEKNVVDPDANLAYMVACQRKYVNHLTATIYLGGRSLQPTSSHFTHREELKPSVGISSGKNAGTYIDWTRRDYREALPTSKFWNQSQYGGETQSFVPGFEATFPSSFGRYEKTPCDGGDFWMYLYSGIFAEDPHIIEGLNTTASKFITLEYQRESEMLPSTQGGYSSVFGLPNEEVRIHHRTLKTMSIVHSSASIEVDNGIVTIAQFNHFYVFLR